MISVILGIGLGIFAGAGLTYFLYEKSLLKKHEELSKENAKLEALNSDYTLSLAILEDSVADAGRRLKSLGEITAQYNQEIDILQAKKEELVDSVSALNQQAQQSADLLYEKNYNIANLNFEKAAEELALKYQQDKQLYEQEYLMVLEETTVGFNNEIQEKKKELKALNNELHDLRQVVHAAVEASRRKLEEEEKENFYRLCLSDSDIVEIKKLREVIPFIKGAEALNKVIWTIYYQKPYTDLIGRIFGDKKPCGIYKITNTLNGKTYVGQAACVPDRWKQHIKRGIGAEPPTHNKLYPAMLEDGVENFSFEFIEECERSQLNDKEQFWQQYFESKTFGYSIK